MLPACMQGNQSQTVAVSRNLCEEDGEAPRLHDGRLRVRGGAIKRPSEGPSELIIAHHSSSELISAHQRAWTMSAFASEVEASCSIRWRHDGFAFRSPCERTATTSGTAPSCMMIALLLATIAMCQSAHAAWDCAPRLPSIITRGASPPARSISPEEQSACNQHAIRPARSISPEERGHQWQSRVISGSCGINLA